MIQATRQPADYTVSTVLWARDEGAVFAVRRQVFVVEQQIDPALEWDGQDAHCIHALARDADGNAIGTGRLLPDGHIGRMAVLESWRGRGVGRALLAQLIASALAQGYPQVLLHAQTHAIDFYRHAGFDACGEEFLEAGIRHQAMQKRLGD